MINQLGLCPYNPTFTVKSFAHCVGWEGVAGLMLQVLCPTACWGCSLNNRMQQHGHHKIVLVDHGCQILFLSRGSQLV